MKKIVLGLFLLSVMFLSAVKTQAVSYEDAMAQKKPCAVLIYADWADDLNSVMSTFNFVEQQYAGKYNFVRINIAQEEAKSFNKTNYIYPNLPYVLLFKSEGRISRCIAKDCLINAACVKEKMDLFAN